MKQNGEDGTRLPDLMGSQDDSGTCFSSEGSVRVCFPNTLRRADGLPQSVMSAVPPIFLALHGPISETTLYHAH